MSSNPNSAASASWAPCGGVEDPCAGVCGVSAGTAGEAGWASHGRRAAAAYGAGAGGSHVDAGGSSSARISAKVLRGPAVGAAKPNDPTDACAGAGAGAGAGPDTGAGTGAGAGAGEGTGAAL